VSNCKPQRGDIVDLQCLGLLVLSVEGSTR